ncbi:MAG TPA: hypothetical protein VGN00_10170 [Puia sp.]|jgi:hypothetical protein
MKTLIILSAFLLVLSSCTKECPVPDPDCDSTYIPDPDPGYDSDPGYDDPDPDPDYDDSDPDYDPAPDPGDDGSSTCGYNIHAGGSSTRMVSAK